MRHLIERNDTTTCCETHIRDLPIGDDVTADPKKVSCGRIPIRDPEKLAEFLYEEVCRGVRGTSGRTWETLGCTDQGVWTAACERALWILEGEEARPPCGSAATSGNAATP